MIPTSHGETFNILRYEVLQKYDTHYDVFDPFEYGNIQNERESMLKYYGTSSIDDCDELILDSYLASEANENERNASPRIIWCTTCVRQRLLGSFYHYLHLFCTHTRINLLQQRFDQIC
ncbi:uncharacterized protein [Arachis hypogaea]|uniref:uncharacterized protein isoform X4 n=1 Tax=Arachis hypogaea TaxID=3818 RepID=UPI003B216D44